MCFFFVGYTNDKIELEIVMFGITFDSASVNNSSKVIQSTMVSHEENIHFQKPCIVIKIVCCSSLK